MAVSFTRTAAVEIASRDVPLDKGQVGTLHAMAYRAIDRPKVADEILDQWNNEQPGYSVSGGYRSVDDAPAEIFRSGSQGDLLMGEMEILRARLVPVDHWPVRTQALYRKWQEFKERHEVVDFTDMIEQALTLGSPAPGEPRVIFADEVQDMTPAELSLLRMWGSHAERLVIAGDDDQAIFSFKGATPDAFLDPPIGEEDKRFLKQSYRVPEQVLVASQHWIRRVGRREEKEYLPRDAEGEVRLAPFRFKEPGPLINEVRGKLDEGKSVMIQASCSYMIDSIKHQLRDLGLPFHNPYRRGRGDWNPLNPGRGVSSAERLLAYLIMDERLFGDASRLWTGGDVKAWAAAVKKKGIFRRGAASAIRDLPDRELTYEEVASLFDDELELEQAVQPSPEWFERNLLSANRKPMKFPLAILKNQGPQGLTDEPKIMIGTIHCSPPDEPVLTTEGWVPIGDLDSSRHRLAGYHRNTNRLTWGGRRKGLEGFGFLVSRRVVDEPLVMIETTESRTRVTKDHRVLARFNEEFENRWVVYLMRKGDWWRVGHCTSARRPYVSGGLGGRLASEQADEGWVLSVHDDKQSAILEEAFIQGYYGVPGLTFRSSSSRRRVETTQLEDVHERTKGMVDPRARALLVDRGLLVDAPLWSRAKKANMRSTFVTAAANLVPLTGRVDIPTVPPPFAEGARGERFSPNLRRGSASLEDYQGEVCGLDVPPHHFYVSGGAVVHNSFKGGQADVVYLFPDLSKAGALEWRGQAGPERRDSVIRQMYVGMTRAREELVLCSASSQLAVPPSLMMEGVRGE